MRYVGGVAASSEEDIGAQINAAYASLPAQGGTIIVVGSARCYDFVTPIAAAVPGKYLLLAGSAFPSGSAARKVCLNYVPTTASSAITLDYVTPGEKKPLSPHGIRNVTIVNNQCETIGGCGSNATGITLGSLNEGALGATFDNLGVVGFGTGINITNSQTNGGALSFRNCSISYNNSGFEDAQGDVEYVSYDGCHFQGNGSALSSTASLTVSNSWIISNTILGVSCLSPATCELNDDHFENLDADTTHFLAGDGIISVLGGDMRDDSVVGNADWWVKFAGASFFVLGTVVTSAGRAPTSVILNETKGVTEIHNNSTDTIKSLYADPTKITEVNAVRESADGPRHSVPAPLKLNANDGRLTERPLSALLLILGGVSPFCEGELADCQISARGPSNQAPARIVVVDGTKYKTIQDALDASPSGSATIIVPTNQTITTGLRIAAPNIALVCENGVTITKGANIDMLTITAPGAVIRGCTFDGQQANWTGGAIDLIAGSGSALVENNTFTNMKDSLLAVGAIYLSSSSKNTIRNNRLLSINAFGIHGRNNSDGNVIDGNDIDTTLSNNMNNASDISAHAATPGQTVNDWIIENNKILHGGASFCIEVGDFGGQPALHTIVKGNDCKVTVAGPLGCYSMGSTGPTGSRYSVIEGNTCDANGFPVGMGFELSNADHATMTGNAARMGAQSGYAASAFRCDPCRFSTVTGNHGSASFSGTNEAIFSYENSYAVDAGSNTWTNNVADLTGSTVAAYGFRIQCHNNSANCSNNYFAGNKGQGMNIPGDAGLRIDRSGGTMTGNVAGMNAFTNFNAPYDLDSGTFTCGAVNLPNQ